MKVEDGCCCRSNRCREAHCSSRWRGAGAFVNEDGVCCRSNRCRKVVSMAVRTATASTFAGMI
ncbi:hypothetical protein DEO72_LG3g677 [Vigna unguiculata]|uniref:Uncharacterized protein n=1 Tax=Vigna unguiculata TaxID=3917 RepID=A0A4D6LCN5_VIGUN|nr:hypothetical protein DEO72_LG3g677 [Vigna unguiculata]